MSRRPPQNAKSLRPRQLKRRSKKDLRPRGRFWAQGPQVVPSHLGNPIAENLDPRHGDSDIAPVLRQSFILLAMFETFVDFAGLQRSRAARERRLPEEFKPHLKRTPRYADRRSFGPKTRRIGHRSRAASEHHCTGHVRDIRRLWSRTLPIRPEPENRYFS